MIILEISVCALGHPRMEEEYLKVVPRYSDGGPGKRGIDSLTKLFAVLAHQMTETRHDILGDLFEGAITYGERGQFLTPEPICQMMAQMQLPAEATGIEDRKTVGDPCSGSGRMLLAAADIQPNWQFIGQDVDLRCVRMTALNLGWRNLYGKVLWGNSLGTEVKAAYETGRVQIYGNAIRKLAIEAVQPVPVPEKHEPMVVDENTGRGSQLNLF